VTGGKGGRGGRFDGRAPGTRPYEGVEVAGTVGAGNTKKNVGQKRPSKLKSSEVEATLERWRSKWR